MKKRWVVKSFSVFTLVSSLILSGCEGIFESFSDPIDQISETPADFQCDEVGLEELDTYVNGNIDNWVGVLEEEVEWFSTNDPEGEKWIASHNYLRNINNTIQNKCSEHYYGVFEYCMSNRFYNATQYGQDRGLDPVLTPGYETSNGNGISVPGIGFVGTVENTLDGPIEEFGIESREIQFVVPNGQGGNSSTGTTVLLPKYDNEVTDRGDFNSMISCFQQAIGYENGSDGDYNRRKNSNGQNFYAAWADAYYAAADGTTPGNGFDPSTPTVSFVNSMITVEEGDPEHPSINILLKLSHKTDHDVYVGLEKVDPTGSTYLNPYTVRFPKGVDEAVAVLEINDDLRADVVDRIVTISFDQYQYDVLVDETNSSVKVTIKDDDVVDVENQKSINQVAHASDYEFSSDELDAISFEAYTMSFDRFERAQKESNSTKKAQLLKEDEILRLIRVDVEKAKKRLEMSAK